MIESVNQVTRAVSEAAIEVHRKLGPGLLESAYHECLCRELLLRGIPFERERPLPVEYKNVRLYAEHTKIPIMRIKGREFAALQTKDLQQGVS